MKILKAFINREKIKYFDRISMVSSFFNSTLGNYSRIYSFSRVTDSKIGNFTYISHQCIINNCEIGNYCSIARGVKIGLGKHPTNFISTSPIFYSLVNPLKKIVSKSQKFTEFERTFIGSDVWIGVNTLLADGVTIGDGAIIGANAIVTKDIPPFAIAVGCPAKVIKYRFSEENIEKLLSIKWWEKDISELESYLNLFQYEVDDNVINNLINSIK
ncbi:CatB-related O-acetyltransferase [Geminocystis sp. NIES-3709]|uniref:CatB-related O-acetyltransferase n=1 Tax=Geminocystis sp. NIES-3709 TaxID=1617448 RepID=UPI0005FCB08B|nr:CatB-related O-acetyltransferase [Geminocystis sp. NIES-3709]BAQ64650.1 acetyltransferase [Geminocystis sp. NIES-3709]